MSREGTAELMDYTRNFPKVDFEQRVREIENDFREAKCTRCGKYFFRTYFVLCGDCLTALNKSKGRITFAST